MSQFTVLGDSAIRQLLLNLSREEIKSFQHDIEDCLISISPGNESDYQPSPGIINRPDGQKILFRPFTSPENVGTKIIVHPAPAPETSESAAASRAQQALHGIVVLVDKCGFPTGILNAEEITGYRTTMSAMITYSWRRHTEHILIFGAGKQALWHSRLALALRGDEIKSITIVNRSLERAQELIQTVNRENSLYWKSSCQLRALAHTQEGFGLQLQTILAEADAIFCTVPSREPLFPIVALNLEKRSRPPFISAVGSWQPDMIEVDPAILHHVTETRGFNKNDGTLSSGAVIVDDDEHALIHAGEIVRSGLNKDQIVSIGQVLSWKREGSLGAESTHDLNWWLAEGLIVYKSIGVSVTDLVAGNTILALAAKKDLGTFISDF
jgi:ornithine cyclodeaminase/alanine dehydrogenase-like protein (mu-crystallin family)